MGDVPVGAIRLREQLGCRRDEAARSLSYVATVPVAAVNESLLDELEVLASDQQRNARLCLHASKDSVLQEMVIVQAAERFFPPKRHNGKAKSFTVLRGVLGVFWFDADGTLAGASALSQSGCRVCRIEAGVYHADIPLTRTALHHEVTTGPFLGDADREIAPWGPSPQRPDAMLRFRAELIRQAGLRDLAMPPSP